MKSDTIAAVATAMSPSGIGIIRLSGDESLNIIDKIYRSKMNNKKTESATAKKLFSQFRSFAKSEFERHYYTMQRTFL